MISLHFSTRFLLLLGVSLVWGCAAINAFAQVGASTPFTTCEAEAGTLAGGAAVVSLASPPTTQFSSPQLEASGHAYVQLTGTGQSVTWTNNTTQSITAFNVRESIPPTADGNGQTVTLDLYVNGTLRQVLTFNSKQTWLYESPSDYDGMNTTTGSGTYPFPHIFWDEVHAFVAGAPIAPGSTITLQQDSSNTAAFYYIDCIDLEAPPAPLAQPANSLSITSYGAVANNPSVDATVPLQNCINAAQSSGQTVWIPQGVFYMNVAPYGVFATGITIAGAGPWYSVLYVNTPNPITGGTTNIISPTSCTLQNFSVDSSSRSALDNTGGLNVKGNGWVVNNLWIRHLGAGVWADGTNGVVENCRVTNSWGDGININNGNGGTNNNIGNNLTVTNNFVRGSGDDAIAIACGNFSGCIEMSNPVVTNNTTVAPWWANGMGVYGGINDLVRNNLITDSVKEHGLYVGVFGSIGFDLQSGLFQGNTILRGGSNGFGLGYPALGVGTHTQPYSVDSAYISSNLISNSMFAGIGIFQNTGNVVIQNNVINAPGTSGINVTSDASGNALLNNNLLSNLGAGQAAILDNSTSFTFDTTSDLVAGVVEAASYNSASGGIGTQACSEGGVNIDGVTTGAYTVYNNLNLNGVTSFAARVASSLPPNQSAGTISVYLDSPTGTLIGTCSCNGTGGSQNWATVSCPVSGASGYHNVYLVYNGTFNVEWLAFQNGGGGTVEAASCNAKSSGIGTEACSEGGLDVNGISNGSYTLYNNVDLNGVASFTARVASNLPMTTANAGTIAVYLDSPSGTPVGTCSFNGTGGSQNWATVSCTLTGVNGYHNVYLVYSGTLSLESFSFEGCGNSVEATSANGTSTGMNTQSCSEGGLCLGNIWTGDYSVYSNVNLNGVTQFAVRTASGYSPGCSISVCLDSPTGTVIGTVTVPDTGGWQTWATQTCTLSGATGYHNVYLVYTGALNVESFAFEQEGSSTIEAASNNGTSTGMNTQSCSEGGLCLGNIWTGDYSVYSNVNLNGVTQFAVRTASGYSPGCSISVCLDSPTGTVIGTVTVPDTGGWQTWATQTCTLSGATGYHNVYLVYTGALNVESLQLQY
jgi:hypothetical protein